jgi:hypothetical protein
MFFETDYAMSYLNVFALPSGDSLRMAMLRTPTAAILLIRDLMLSQHPV